MRQSRPLAGAHPARDFIEQRYARNLTTLAGHLREAIDENDIAPMTEAQIQIEVRLVTAAMDGIGLQWLLEPSTNVDGSIATYIDRAINAWRNSRGWALHQEDYLGR